MTADPGPRALAALGLAQDSAALPLTYPGRPPAESGLLAGECFLALREDPGAPPGDWGLDGESVTLDDALRSRGRPAMAERHPVLAVGANGSPGRMHLKLDGRGPDVVPMTYAAVGGLLAGVSAHVSRPGCVPAAPVLAPGASCRLIVVWLDDEQLAVVDATEPNYRRVRVPGPATVAVPGCELYAGRHGCLTDGGGTPYTLTAQGDLLSALLADLPELARLTGASGPEEFSERTRREPELRERIRALWRSAGRVLHQPALMDGAGGDQ